MKIITNQKGIMIEFEKEDTQNEIELARCTIQQLLCLLRITNDRKSN